MPPVQPSATALLSSRHSQPADRLHARPVRAECDQGVFCAEDTDPADCALPDLEALEIDVSGTLFCETADFFNNSAVDECVVQPCCEWVDDRCQSAVGDESCDRGLWSEGAPPQQDSGDELEEFFEELFAAGDDDDDDDEEEEDDSDDADELTPAATALSVPQGEAAAESDEDGRSSADDVFLPLISAAGVLLLGALLFVGRRAGWCSSVQNGGRKETEAVARDSTAETATLQGGGMKEDSSDANP